MKSDVRYYNKRSVIITLREYMQVGWSTTPCFKCRRLITSGAYYQSDNIA